MTETIAFEIRAEDNIAASWLILRRRWKAPKLIAFVGILTAIYVAAIVVQVGLECDCEADLLAEVAWEAAPQGVMLAVLLAFVTIAICGIAIPRKAREYVRQLGVEGTTAELTIDDEGLRYLHRDGSANYEWSRFTGWAEDRRSLIIRLVSPAIFYVPKSQVPPEVIASLKFHLNHAAIPRF